MGRLYGAYLSPLRFRGKCERKGKEKGNILVLSMLCGDGEGKGVSTTVIKVGRRQTNEPDEPRPAIRLCPVLFPCAEMLSSYVGRFQGLEGRRKGKEREETDQQDSPNTFPTRGNNAV